MDYRPMQVSLTAIIASFPSVKECVDQGISNLVQGIDDMIGAYQLDGDDTYLFGRDRQYAWFRAPFQAYHWANSEVLFVDIDYTGCHHFPYLLNAVCKNSNIWLVAEFF